MKLTTPLYAATLILSAFLLFSVEPMFAKMILPLLGGSPSVWNIAMVFFQAMLLAGYAYAHGTSRHLGIRPQAIVHLTLLLICAAVLPLALPEGLKPSGDPALWQIGIMALYVGAPFFILSASAPIIQHWFSASGDKDAANPYFLYAASNIGSMVALLSYPIIVEPQMTLKMQSMAWSCGYAVVIGLVVFCALMVWNREIDRPVVTADTKIPTRTKLVWMTLAFIPSSLMLGVTTYITTDLASLPLLWVLPLSLYLLTFILVFARKPLVDIKYTSAVFTGLLVLLFFFMSTNVLGRSIAVMLLHLATFFFASLLCHKKLADMRPAVHDLTGFYMYMSLGGVLGGMFNALLAPILFVIPLEYTLGLCAALCVRAWCLNPDNMRLRLPDFRALMKRPSTWLIGLTVIAVAEAWISDQNVYYLMAGTMAVLTILALRPTAPTFTVVMCLLLLAFSPTAPMKNAKIIELRRNFFGVLQVNESNGTRNFLHGTTLHGAQPLDPKYRLVPMTYYNPLGPLGDVFNAMDKRPVPQKIGAIGLGTGTVSCYHMAGRSFDFFEIDPDVVKIAEDKNLFTYLSDCRSRYTVTLGDGRLTLNQVPDGSYDMLILDAFSSDNIPMHLLTLEAFRIYMHKVKPNGIIAINISNRYLNLEPQLAALSKETRVPVMVRHSYTNRISPKSDLIYTGSIWAVFSPNPATLISLGKAGNWTPVKSQPGFRLWTDDYANIISSLRVLHPKIVMNAKMK